MAPNIFISYRRSDAAASARQLADALKRHFGDGQVFLDVRDVDLGAAWHLDIQRRVRDSDVVLVVIGRAWLAAVSERGRRRFADGEEDVLRVEIDSAFRCGRLVVPVLVDDAAMPARDALPRALKALTTLEAATLRHASWDVDVVGLIAQLDRAVPGRRSELDTDIVTVTGLPPVGDAAPAARTLPPDDEHYAEVVECLMDDSLVLMLGPGINGANSPWREGCGRLPTADELAVALAKRFRLPAADLARISQHILLRRGPGELHKALRELLIRADCQPTPGHRFLARLPRVLSDRRQLIVTTNYDTALEQAFDEAHEPFDLVVFMATGEDKGRFVHVPWDGEPTPIERPNEFVDFPIGEDGELERTVLMKIHGGPRRDLAQRQPLTRNYVITEDDYIAYLSRSPAESLVPTQLLRMLRESHLLFLGYGVGDWSLRVFLQRVWVDDRPENSWAIQPSLDRLDLRHWDRLHVVERFALPLTDYLEELERHLAGGPASP